MSNAIKNKFNLNNLEKMIIEKAKLADAKQILKLQKFAYASEAKLYNDYNIPPLTQTLEEILKEFNDQYFLKAIIEEEIIGSVRAYLKNNSCFIGRLIVHPDHQNKGIGTRLMTEIENHFRHSERFELFTGHKSEKNIRFYKNLGYKIYKIKKVNENIKFIYLEKMTK